MPKLYLQFNLGEDIKLGRAAINLGLQLGTNLAIIRGLQVYYITSQVLKNRLKGCNESE
jgi:hypothetical protein